MKVRAPCPEEVRPLTKFLPILVMAALVSHTSASAAAFKLASEMNLRAEGRTLTPGGVLVNGGLSVVLAESAPVDPGYAATVRLWRLDATGAKLNDAEVARIARAGKRLLPKPVSGVTTLPVGDIMMFARLNGVDESILRVTPEGKVVFQVRPGADPRSEPIYSRIIAAEGGGAVILGSQGVHAVALWLSADGSVVLRKEYDFDEYNMLSDGVRLPDGTYLFSGAPGNRKALRNGWPGSPPPGT